jgi:hypothetical protein
MGRLGGVLRALAVAALGVGLPAPATAAVIIIEQPTPAAGVASPPTGIDPRIGAGVPNTGGVAPDGPPPGTPATSSATGVATTTNAQLAVRVLPTTNAEVVAIAGLGTSSRVRVVLIGAADPGLAELNRASAQTGESDRLRAAINGNQPFKAELAANGVDVAKIMAAELTSEGVLILYALT